MNANVQDEILKRFKRGQLLTRQQVLELGATNPAREMQMIRKKHGMVIAHVTAIATPFWVAPAEAAANGVDWSKRALARL
jgi:hypothetical protein